MEVFLMLLLKLSFDVVIQTKLYFLAVPVKNPYAVRIIEDLEQR